jgi:hypothetical protein
MCRNAVSPDSATIAIFTTRVVRSGGQGPPG